MNKQTVESPLNDAEMVLAMQVIRRVLDDASLFEWVVNELGIGDEPLRRMWRKSQAFFEPRTKEVSA